jgi:hypothetical protein
MQEVWNPTKRPNLQIIGLEEGEQIQTNSIDDLLNNSSWEFPQSWEREGHPDLGSLQNTKPSGPQKIHTQTYHNQKTQYIEQRKNSESCKKEKSGHV